ncbi:MAG: hypothetical protein M5U34_25970 [Chloroflexi bacterium]|nr:hypothetical protein [Chloroflexota bacterium]
MKRETALDGSGYATNRPVGSEEIAHSADVRFYGSHRCSEIRASLWPGRCSKAHAALATPPCA